jgi:iron complex outermembrane recepter protein
MKTPKHQIPQQRLAGATAERSTFKLNPLTAACAMAIFAASSMAYAQTATTEAAKAAAPVVTKAEKDKAEAAKKAANTVDTIVVTGIRRGIEAAISVKQNSNSIVEAISAEDIGKLPDNSIAESIARLPGLAAQRVAGRSSTVSIRGMSGDFAGTLLNGREQVSTGDNRAVEFDQYPSELLAGVTVYKTPDGALIGQGLSGTVDLQTVRPLNFSKQTVAINLRGEKNSLGKLNADSKDTGNRFSASYIDQSADKKFGIALGFAHLDSPSQAQRWEAWGYPCNDKGECALGGNKVFADSTNQKRDGVMAVLEFKPNADYSSVVDLYYSKFDKKTVLRGFEAGLVWGDGTTLTNPVIENKFLVSGTWNGVKPVVRNDLNKQKDDLSAFGWNNKFNVGNGWTAVADLSFSQAKRAESILETYAGTIPGSVGAKDTFTFRSNNDTGLPNFKVGLNYADPNIIKLVDSGGWGQDGYIKYLNVKDEASAFRLSGKKELEGVFSAVDFGLNYSTRKKSKDVPEYFVNLKTRPAGTSASVPTGSLLSPSNISFVGMPGILAYDIQAVVDQLYTLKPNFNKDITNKNWVVEEKIVTAFAKADIDTLVGDMPLRGNLGLQIINTDQSSRAFAVADGNAVSGVSGISGGKKYTDYLPSLNLALSLPAEQTVRLGLAQTMTRARLDQMRASSNFSLGVTNRQWSGDGGNPKLDPFRANVFDLAYEKYFGNKAYIAAAYFYKDLKSYIYQDKVAKDFTGFPNPTNGAVTPISNIGSFDTPTNGKGGNMKGIELSASVPLNLLASVLDGFGVVVSHSDTDSSIKPNGPGNSQPLPGLSKRVTNLTAYYEKYGFSARISNRSRSDFVGEVAGFGADREFVYVRGENITDVQLGYSFDAGMFKGLSVLLQMNNLDNTPYRTYEGVKDKPKVYSSYGRTVLFGVNYKF